MKKTNGQSGITLIALVVTIIVLLILAGVTINFVLSDGGIFGKAKEAGSATKVAAVKEYINNAITTMFSEIASTGKASLESTTIDSILAASIPKNADTDTYAFTEKTVTYAVDTGVVIKLTGTVTSSGVTYDVKYDSSSTTNNTVQVTVHTDAE